MHSSPALGNRGDTSSTTCNGFLRPFERSQLPMVQEIGRLAKSSLQTGQLCPHTFHAGIQVKRPMKRLHGCLDVIQLQVAMGQPHRGSVVARISLQCLAAILCCGGKVALLEISNRPLIPGFGKRWQTLNEPGRVDNRLVQLIGGIHADHTGKLLTLVIRSVSQPDFTDTTFRDHANCITLIVQTTCQHFVGREIPEKAQCQCRTAT